MNAQERELLTSFLDQMVQAQAGPKDMEAETLIRNAAARQPDALYLLVQRAMQLDYALKATQAEAAKPADKGSSKPRTKKLSFKETRELESIEQTILDAETEVKSLEELFAAPDFYQTHGDQWEKLQKKLNESRHQIARLYARWEELEALKSSLG